MIALVLTITGSSLIFVLFRYFSKFGIDTFQAIVFNYFTAFVCGYFLTAQPWSAVPTQLASWGGIALLCAILFISLFVIMGLSSQRNGVSRTSVAVKMSMAVSLLGMILYYREEVSTLKIIGIIAAFLGVYFTAVGKGTERTSAGWMLFVLFIGSGLLDFLLNFVEKQHFNPFNSSMFTAFGFLFAGCIGSLLLVPQFIRRKRWFHPKHALAGIILGIPNYFSIYMLIESYRQLDWHDSAILAMINVSVVITSTLLGVVLFRESFSGRKVLGLSLALTAILLLYLATA